MENEKICQNINCIFSFPIKIFFKGIINLYPMTFINISFL